MFGQRLRVLRTRAGLSQEDLAQRAGVGVKTVGNIEAGRTTARPSTLRALADALDLEGADRTDFWAMAAPQGSAQPPTPTAQVIVPAQLPACVPAFAGRATELGWLSSQLAAASGRGPTMVICALSGTAGVGKTALAVRWAHQVADQFPDGQLFVDLRGFDPGGQAVDPTIAIRSFLDALNVPPQRLPINPDAQASLYRSLMTRRRMLIVLDNARDTAQVRPLLPGAPGCLVVVTSRNQLTGLVAVNGARPLTLDLLTVHEARELLAHRLGVDRITAEPDAVEEVITRCARLPLALSLVAAHLAIRPQADLRTLADRLCDPQHRWHTLTGDDPTSDVQAVFSWSYQAVTADTARLFRLLGLHSGPDITAPAAASLAALSIEQVQPLLAELVRANLLVEHTIGRFTLHDLLRTYAAELARRDDSPPQRRAALHRVLDYYLHAAWTADLRLQPHRDPIPVQPAQDGVISTELDTPEAAVAWLTAEQSVLLTTVGHAAGHRFDDHAWKLAAALTGFLYHHGQWHNMAAVQRTALEAARRQKDLQGQAHSHRSLAIASARLDQLDRAHAHLTTALDMFTKLDDLPGQAYVHQTFSRVFDQQGRHSDGVRHTQQAVQLYRKVGHRTGLANALNSLGWHEAHTGDLDNALTHCRQALQLHQDIGNRHGQALTWDSLGYIHQHRGEHDRAIDCYQRAVELYRTIANRYDEADTLIHLADLHHSTGNTDTARQTLQHALAILDDLDHPDAAEMRTRLRGRSLPGTTSR